jgi:hypothetical protein
LGGLFSLRFDSLLMVSGFDIQRSSAFLGISTSYAISSMTQPREARALPMAAFYEKPLSLMRPTFFPPIHSVPNPFGELKTAHHVKKVFTIR